MCVGRTSNRIIEMIWAITQERISERIVAELMLLRLTVAQITPQDSIQCS